MPLPKQSSEFVSRVFPGRKRATGGATPKTYFTLSIAPLKCTTSATDEAGAFCAATELGMQNRKRQARIKRTNASRKSVGEVQHNPRAESIGCQSAATHKSAALLFSLGNEKGHPSERTANRVSRAQRDIDSLRRRGEEIYRRCYEMVRGCSAGKRVAKIGRLLAHGFRGRNSEAETVARHRVGSLQSSDRGQALGASAQFLSDESKIARRHRK